VLADEVKRLAEVPGLGVDSAQQIIAEVGATAATFPSPEHLTRQAIFRRTPAAAPRHDP
jgi:transposase